MARQALRRTLTSKRFRRAPLLLVLIAALATSTFALSSWRASASSQHLLAFRLDHFQCYTVKASAAKSHTVALRDQFRTTRGTTGLLDWLCVPVVKNGRPIRNAQAHLACYALRAPKWKAGVVISNQFQKAARLTVGTPSRLCLPSGKSPIPGPRPLPARKLDHYQCYPARSATNFKPRRVKLRDQFGMTAAQAVRVQSLCTPVRKNKGKVLNSTDHLVCYLLRPDGTFRRRSVRIRNQFGAGRLAVLAPESLCLPSTKRWLRPPDLTVAIANTRTQVNCPGGGGTCMTTVSLTVQNIGGASTVNPFQVQVEADPRQVKAVGAGPLAPGVSQPLTVVLGPDGNCYDADCTVRATVDSTLVIPESNESNNVDTSGNERRES
jgi:hypothetical protein